MLWLMVLLVMPMVRVLQEMLRFTVSPVMTMVRVLQVVVRVWVRVWVVFGLCLGVGCRYSCPGLRGRRCWPVDPPVLLVALGMLTVRAP